MQNFSAGPPSSWSENLAAAKQGDRNALGELLQAYWVPLWHQAFGRLDDELRSKQAASDIVQETLIEAHLHIREFRGSTPGEFQAWLRKMLANNVLDTWRRFSATQKRNCNREVPMTLTGVEAHLKPGAAPSLLEEFLLQERLLTVQNVLELLPEEYRMVIRMRHWDGMKFEAIGDAIGKPPDAARQLWYRAVKHFSQVLEQQDVQ